MRASVDLSPFSRQLWTSLIVGRGATLNSKVYVVEHGHLDPYVFQGSCIIPCALLDLVWLLDAQILPIHGLSLALVSRLYIV